MPGLRDLVRHSNRSHHALASPAEPPVAPVIAAAAGGGTAGAADSPAATRTSSSKASISARTGTVGTVTGNNPANTTTIPHPTSTPYSAISSNTAFNVSQSSFVDSQQKLSTAAGGGAPLPLPPKHHHQIYNPPPNAGDNDLEFDGHRQPEVTPAVERSPAVHRSQSQRYSYAAPLHHQPQQQQQLYSEDHGIASTSLEHLPSTVGHQTAPQPTQPSPGPDKEKKSTRNRIKGIFSGSSRLGGHEKEQESSSSHEKRPRVLTSRTNKRLSSPPSLNTGSSHLKQLSPDHGWQTPGYQSLEASPLQNVGEIEEYHDKGRDSERDIYPQNSQNSFNSNSNQRVSNEYEQGPEHETSTYDEVIYQTQHTAAGPHQQQQLQQLQAQRHPLQHPPGPAPPSSSQPHVQLQHHQDQAQTSHYDQQQPQLYDQQSLHGHSLHQIQQQQHYQYSSTSPNLYQQASDQLVSTSHSGATPQLQRHSPETISQVSRESPVTSDPDQRSANQNSVQTSPVLDYHGQTQDIIPNPSLQSVQLPNQPLQSSVMAPPSGGPLRRGTDIDTLQSPPGAPPSYRHSNASTGVLPPLQPGQPGAHNNAFSAVDQGRQSPQPDGADGERQFKDLLAKYKNVKRLYFDGKSQIEILTGQVEQLQNAIANQRMSQSRTALDDSEYMNRFNRLSGAINNLSFNIRKDWRSLPAWISGFVSADALKTGKQEMTAVGRAVISKWLVEEIFDKIFHPGLDPLLSAQLKAIEKNIRGNAYTMNSQEEYDALTTKIVNWRMATLDGLQTTLGATSNDENRHNLTTKATTNLTALLHQHLNTPPPPEVEGSAAMIVELAIGLAANLPLESRDVAVTYPMPGEIIRPGVMEVEKSELPAPEGKDSDSEYSDEDADKGKAKAGGKDNKSGMWTSVFGTVSPPIPSRKGSMAATGTTRTDLDSKSALPRDISRVRFAGFVALEVRGRQVLMKAPVWAL